VILVPLCFFDKVQKPTIHRVITLTTEREVTVTTCLVLMETMYELDNYELSKKLQSRVVLTQVIAIARQCVGRVSNLKGNEDASAFFPP
jgi:hypothetical protein